MSKMREAFEKWKISLNDNIIYPDDAFEAGYKAAIAAVKEGGADGYVKYVVGGAPHFVPVIAGVAKIEGYPADYTELYRLPEDLT